MATCKRCGKFYLFGVEGYCSVSCQKSARNAKIAKGAGAGGIIAAILAGLGLIDDTRGGQADKDYDDTYKKW